MPDISFPVGLNQRYANSYADIGGPVFDATLRLEHGSHTAISDPHDFGTLHGAPGSGRIVAQFAFGYDYDAEAGVITVSGSDFPTDDGPRIVTTLTDTTEQCVERTDPGREAEQNLANLHWNYRTPLSPRVGDLLLATAKAANEALIEALDRTPNLVVRIRRPLPPLSDQDYRNLSLVYRDGELQGAFDPSQTYGEGYEVVPLQSVFGGEVHFNYGEAFANVIGSTSDPKIAGLSWIALWAGQFGLYPTICTSSHFGGFPCGSSLVGGHIITGTKAFKVPKGSNSVYIMPICIQHNNNDNVYMAALQYQYGIWLKNYLGT